MSSNAKKDRWALLPESVRRRLHKKVMDSRAYKLVFARRVTRMAGAVAEEAHRKDAEYRTYLRAQIEKSFRTTQKVPNSLPLEKRTVHLVGLMKNALAERQGRLDVLCVGCRDKRELDYIEQSCRAEVTGLDLFSLDPRIMVGDMHRMPFDDKQFDCLYSCHSLEHSFDVNVALSEFVRVTKPGGLLVIEVPIEFQPGAVDRCDLGSAANLTEQLGEAIDRVLLREETSREVGGAIKRAARVMVEIR